jgi:hypothetical protein
MKKLKELYSSPTTEFFEVRFEGNILSYQGTNTENQTEYLDEEEDGGELY